MASTERKSFFSYVAEMLACGCNKNDGRVMVPPLKRRVSFRVVKPSRTATPESSATGPCLLKTPSPEDTKVDTNVHIKWNLKSNDFAVFEQGDDAEAHRPGTEAATPAALTNMPSMVRQRTCSRGDMSAACDVLPFPAYDDGQDIEYFSVTHQQWVNGIVHSEASLRTGSNEAAVVVTTLSLARGGQVREDVRLDLLRSPLQAGELVEVFSGRHGGSHLPATIAPDQVLPRSSTQGYHVLIDGTGQVLRNVPLLRLKRRFVPGQQVEVYRGPQRGWELARVHHTATADGCGAEILPLPAQVKSKEHGNDNPGLPVDSTSDARPVQSPEASNQKTFTASDMGLWTLVPVCTEIGQEDTALEWVPSYLICPATDVCAK